jgi:predicted HD phosphohydrolase
MRRAHRWQRYIMEGTVNFTRMDEGTYEEYQFLEGKFKVCYDELPDNVLGALKKLQGDKLGYHVDRCEHSLQTATRAFRDGADEETVVVALLHDIGDLLAPRITATSRPPC